MEAIYQKGQKEGWNKEQYRTALNNIVNKERKSLKTGRRALNKNKRKGAK